MKLTIKQGNHYDDNIFSSWPHLFKTAFRKTVKFDKSCEYDLPAYNSEDVNKLFGGYFGFLAEHKNSARFGWRWSKSDKKIELLAYVYNNGTRNWDEQMRFPVVAQIDLDQEVECEIWIESGRYFFSVKLEGAIIGFKSVFHDKIPFWGLTQSFYFGGTATAPHDMYIFMS